MTSSFSILGKKSNPDQKATGPSVHPLAAIYLKHLGLTAQPASYEYLCALQKRHIEKIPHENIDGIFNLHSSFDIEHLMHKYIVENRGGLCFELNWSYAWLLEKLGFKFEIICSNVEGYDFRRYENQFPTHPIIVVHLDGVRYLTDTGWGDAYRHPLVLPETPLPGKESAGAEYTNQTGKYRVWCSDGQNFVMQKWLDPKQNPDKAKESKEIQTAGWYNQFNFSKPKGPQEKFGFPTNFLAYHAFTHVGPGFIFTDAFEFVRMQSPEGNRSIWINLPKPKEQKTGSTPQILEKAATKLKQLPLQLERDFAVPATVAQKCVQLKRSASMPNFYKPKTEKALIDEIMRPPTRVSPF